MLLEISNLEEKLIQLAIIDAAPLQYLARQKSVKVFIISMQDIKYQLSKNRKTPLNSVLERNYDFLNVFLKKASNTVSAHSKHNHVIRLLDKKNHSQAALHGMSNPQLDFVKKFLKKNLEKGFIKVNSAFCSLPILLAKKPGSDIRFCIDYQKLNKLAKKDTYPILLITEILAQLSHARVFTKIDIQQAFHKLCMTAESEDLTPMIMWFRAYKWRVLPFELTKRPALWQCFINNILWEYLNQFCTAYLDNILIYSQNIGEHKEHVCSILVKLCKFGIQADVDKCKFHVTETKYLSLIISKNSIKIDPAKVEAIKNWSTPKQVKDVQAFIGFCNFYCHFIQNFSRIARLLNSLTKRMLFLCSQPTVRKRFKN